MEGNIVYNKTVHIAHLAVHIVRRPPVKKTRDLYCVMSLMFLLLIFYTNLPWKPFNWHPSFKNKITVSIIVHPWLVKRFTSTFSPIWVIWCHFKALVTENLILPCHPQDHPNSAKTMFFSCPEWLEGIFMFSFYLIAALPDWLHKNVLILAFL